MKPSLAPLELLRNGKVRSPNTFAAVKPANATPPRTHVNTAAAGLYTGPAMACTRLAAGQRSPNGRAA